MNNLDLELNQISTTINGKPLYAYHYAADGRGHFYILQYLSDYRGAWRMGYTIERITELPRAFRDALGKYDGDANIYTWRLQEVVSDSRTDEQTVFGRTGDEFMHLLRPDPLENEYRVSENDVRDNNRLWEALVYQYGNEFLVDRGMPCLLPMMQFMNEAQASGRTYFVTKLLDGYDYSNPLERFDPMRLYYVNDNDGRFVSVHEWEVGRWLREHIRGFWEGFLDYLTTRGIINE